MPNTSSPLGTTQPYIPLVHPTMLGRAAGLIMCFPSVQALVAAVNIERQNVEAGNAIWAAGQPLVLVEEFFASGIFRVWNGTNARSVWLRPGVLFELSDDERVLLSGYGVPLIDLGADGDYYVDWGESRWYYRDGDEWIAGSLLYESGGGTPSGLPIPADNQGNDVILRATGSMTIDAGGPITLGPAPGVPSPFSMTLVTPQLIVGTAANAYGGASIYSLGSIGLQANNGGQVNLTATGPGGRIEVQAGSTGTPGVPGETVYIRAGNATASFGGSVDLKGGDGSLDGGDGRLRAGNTTSGTNRGGDVSLTVGVNTLTGAQGRIRLHGLDITGNFIERYSLATGSGTVTHGTNVPPTGVASVSLRRWIPVIDGFDTLGYIPFYAP